MLKSSVVSRNEWAWCLKAQTRKSEEWDSEWNIISFGYFMGLVDNNEYVE